jgi:hypothetical protein
MVVQGELGTALPPVADEDEDEEEDVPADAAALAA